MNTGGAAFPFQEMAGSNVQWAGMSLRDWFAGLALAGYVADDMPDGWTNAHVAAIAYGLADAMLVVREKP